MKTKPVEISEENATVKRVEPKQPDNSQVDKVKELLIKRVNEDLPRLKREEMLKTEAYFDGYTNACKDILSSL